MAKEFMTLVALEGDHVRPAVIGDRYTSIDAARAAARKHERENPGLASSYHIGPSLVRGVSPVMVGRPVDGRIEWEETR